jgi:hypothetical protein
MLIERFGIVNGQRPPMIIAEETPAGPNPDKGPVSMWEDEHCR